MIRTASLLLAAAVLGAVLAAPAAVACPDNGVGLDSRAGTRRLTLAVEGVTCAGCTMRIRKALHELEGVRVVDEGSTKDRLIVEFEEARVSPAQIVEAVRRVGFGAKIVR
jgi:copper chaperone CopZ